MGFYERTDFSYYKGGQYLFPGIVRLFFTGHGYNNGDLCL